MSRPWLGRLAAGLLALSAAVAARAEAPPAWPVHEGAVDLEDFHFKTGDTVPLLHLHYLTLGTPHRDAAGRVDNAVLLLHGTGGDAHSLLAPQFSRELFGPGQLLDTTRYYLIFPDDIGHGQSSKPSDGLRMRFPAYDYDDMVSAQRAMLDAMKVNHLRLILGTSMGCMQTFLWGETYPDFADALAPFACLPVQIAGRNRMVRHMAIEFIKRDPAWNGGNYDSEPTQGLRAAAAMIFLMGSSPLQMQKAFPTRDAADTRADAALDRAVASTDANDMIYYLEASRIYDPSPRLETITAPVLWINSADDFVNPPELGIAERLAPRLRRGRFVLIPTSDATRGHGTHTQAAVWKDRLAAFLAETERK